MASWWDRLTGKDATAPTAQTGARVPAAMATQTDAYRRLDQEIPLQGEAGRQAFVRREAILDAHEKVAGYEFSLQGGLRSRLEQHAVMARRAYDAALIGRLAANDISSLLGHRLAFVCLYPESLALPLPESLPTTNTVLLLDGQPSAEDHDPIVERIDALRQRGFQIGLRLQGELAANDTLLARIDFMQVVVESFDGVELALLRKRYAPPAGGAKLRWIARDLQTHDDFQLCHKLHFDYFQGHFVASRESWQPPQSGVNRGAVFGALQRLRAEAGFAEVAEAMKNEPQLTYRLLRYLNSPVLGLRSKVDSLGQALVVIGRDRCYRWLSLLLFQYEKTTYRERVLTEQALCRGRTLELLAGKGRLPANSEHLFLVGLFSLLDIALGQPLAELLGQAAVPEPVQAALLGTRGPLRDALLLAVCGEAGSPLPAAAMAKALERCDLPAAAFDAAAGAALVWAHELTANMS